MYKMLVYLLIYLFLVSLTSSFNLSPEFPIIVEDPSYSRYEENYFGFTVGLQRHREINGLFTPWVVVGSPRSQSSFYSHVSINKPGVVYQCRLNVTSGGSQCNQLILDPTGNQEEYYEGEKYIDRKDNSMLGFILDLEGTESGKILACAPRWKNQRFSDYYLMNGACYALKDSRDPSATAQKLLPLLRKDKQDTNMRNGKGVFYYAYGEAGFSAHVAKNGNEILMGAPGVLEWAGTVIKYHLSSTGTFENVIVPSPYKDGTDFQPNSYFGYSVSSGKFSSHSQHLYVSGAPRGSSCHGEVIVFDFPVDDRYPIDIKFKLQGTQMGEYFGASLCVVDLNSDGFDDILVGAPEFSISKFDEGRVYVYINQGDGAMKEVTKDNIVAGFKRDGARFGTAISTIGDINLDGYPDVAVGAPFESSTSNIGPTGAVYIYHGGKETPMKFVQRIAAGDIDKTLRGFGISISRGVDIDSNRYNDIAIGAFQSDKVVILRSRPIIIFKPSVHFRSKEISFDMENNKLDFEFCLTFKGEFASNTIDANITVTFDRTYNRIFWPNGKNKYSVVATLSKDTAKCQPVFVFTRKSKEINIRNLYIPVEMNMHYDIEERIYNNFCQLCPVVDPTSVNVYSEKFPVKSECGKKQCIPKWEMVAGFKSTELPFVIGLENFIPLNVYIKNVGDKSYIKTLQITLPEYVRLKNIPSSCVEDEKVRFLECNMGQSIDSGQQLIVELNLNVENIPSETEELKFYILLFDYFVDGIAANVNLTLPLQTVTKLIVRGKSSPDSFIAKRDNYGILTHGYEIVNEGPSPITSVDIDILIPTAMTWNENQLTLLEVYQPEVQLGSETYGCFSEEEFKRESNLTTGFSNFTEDGETNMAGFFESINPISILYQVTYGTGQFNISCTDDDIHCMSVHCKAGPFPRGSTTALVIIRTFVVAENMNQLFEEYAKLQVNTSLSVEVSVKSSRVLPANSSVSTIFDGLVPSRQTPWLWLYILIAVIVAIAILILIIFILRKLGFFKRLKPDDDNNEELLKENEAEVSTNNADEEG